MTLPSLSSYRDQFLQRFSAQALNLVFLRTVDSTNSLARKLVEEFVKEGLRPPETAVVALEQTAGRGRLGRRWVSPEGAGIYVTLVLNLDNLDQVGQLPLAVAVGLCRRLDEWLPGGCRLKWPNDLLVRGKKIGGVLIESGVRAGGYSTAVVGFGINHDVNSGAVDPERATSVRREAENGPSIVELTADLVAGVVEAVNELTDQAVFPLDAYRAFSAHREGDRIRCRLGDRVFEGLFLGFSDEGLLRLEREGDEVLISSGEIIEWTDPD